MSVGLQTAGGRVNVRWDASRAATPMGQLAFFIEFLTLTGLWERWKNECPLFYTSPNAPEVGDVLGTWLLSILSGHKRYAHVTAIRCDGVNPDLLGMNRIVSEDALRRALKAIDPDLGTAWLDKHLRESTRALLDAPWILDIDTTIKPPGDTPSRGSVGSRATEGALSVARGGIANTHTRADVVLNPIGGDGIAESACG